MELYSTTNNKPQFSKVTDLIPVAVANNCDFVYYRDANDGTLYYYQNGADNPVICYKGEEDYTLRFNRDFSEVLIDTASGTQMWKNGKQTVIAALKAGEGLEFLPNKRAQARTLPTAYQYLVKTFEKGYYLKSGSEESGNRLCKLFTLFCESLPEVVIAYAPDCYVSIGSALEYLSECCKAALSLVAQLAAVETKEDT